jgi:ribonuclease PH
MSERKRRDGRSPEEHRPIEIQRGFTDSAPGSVLIRAGGTMLLCTATWTESVPNWLNGQGHGWLTAEYSMLPGSTRNRKTREIRTLRPDGRGIEIQRLIGRSLRAAVEIEALPEVSIWIDCDVLAADGGTRTLAITGGYLALHDVLRELERKGRIRKWPLQTPIAACSVGLVDDVPLLDLDYSEDSRAQVDMNVVYTGDGEFAEVQASGERSNLRRDQLDALLDLAEIGGRSLLDLQARALEAN